MKNLIVISGPIGIGKSSVAQEMLKKLKDAILLDGDHIGNGNISTQDTQALEERNILFLLNTYLQSNAYENILFVWSRSPKQIEQCIKQFESVSLKIIRILLLGSECALTTHLLKDFSLGKIELSQIKQIVTTLNNYIDFPFYIKKDVSGTSVEKITSEIFHDIK